VLKTDDRRFPAGRWTGQPTNEVVTVGEQAWWRAKGPFREATVAPGLADGTTREFVGLERAAKASRHLTRIGPDRYVKSSDEFTELLGPRPLEGD
jgi:hypothetical protein